MPAAAKFASGKFAKGICDVCGVGYMLFELRMTTIRGQPTHIMACPTCWDLDHPQNFLPYAVHMDAEALRLPRPEDYYMSRILPHWRPCDALPSTIELGDVEVQTS
jgi:hypothetical protein